METKIKKPELAKINIWQTLLILTHGIMMDKIFKQELYN